MSEPSARSRGTRLTDSRLRSLAGLTFAGCVVFYLIDGLVPLVGRAAAGQGWRWGATPLDVTLVVVTALFPIVGVLIARRQPRNAVAWIMLAAGVLASLPLIPYYEYALEIRPGSMPAGAVVAAIAANNWAPIVGLIGMFLILLFPDGHLPSRRWRWVGWFAASATVYVYLAGTFTPGEIAGLGVENPLGVSFLGGRVGHTVLLSLVIIPVGIGLCAGALVVRFRRSRGPQRLQLKWLATAGAMVAVAYGVAMVANLAAGGDWTAADPLWLQVVENVGVFSFALIPLAIGAAILRYRLYDIDMVISRSLVFGALATFITVVYVTIVVGVGRLLGSGGRPSLVLPVAATAVVAVAFEPVRDRLQRFANRLVYGERATPYEVLSAFADRVGGAYDATQALPLMARTVAQGVDADRSGCAATSGSSSPRPGRSSRVHRR
jgi:hypothetical protein